MSEQNESTDDLTLDDIRAAVERKYAALPVCLGDGTKVVLLNPLRLDKAKRAHLEQAQKAMKEQGADQVDCLKDIIRTVAERRSAGDKLLREIGDDAAMLAELFATYGKRCKPGEASA